MRPHRTVTAQMSLRHPASFLPLVPPSLLLTSIGRALTSSGVRDPLHRPITNPAAPAVEAPSPGLAARSSQASQPSPSPPPHNHHKHPKHPQTPLPRTPALRNTHPITPPHHASSRRRCDMVGDRRADGREELQIHWGDCAGLGCGRNYRISLSVPRQSINILYQGPKDVRCESAGSHTGLALALAWGRRACMHARSVAAWEGGRQWLRVPVYPSGRPSDTFFLCSLSCIALITGFWLQVPPLLSLSLSALSSLATAIRR